MEECMHARPGGRFDPGMTEGSCPVCGAGVGAAPGEPVAMHQRQGSLETCPGSGQPAS
ncbi:hypothetical protein AB0N31_10730 [Streptomyces sp. NPDC051051]|uniref:hypothetical protein n=1 Tax=Streptomyces sp. NPDC051051 TaxID=3155666 RepID=UPI003428C5F4